MGRKKKQNGNEEKIAGYEIVRLNLRDMQKDNPKFSMTKSNLNTEKIKIRSSEIVRIVTSLNPDACKKKGSKYLYIKDLVILKIGKAYNKYYQCLCEDRKDNKKDNILEADEETFRSIYDIYNDIAKVYDQMSDKDASALLDLIAGKNRSNQISAILQNMSEANELLEKSLNATGTASAEYEIYLNSAQAATERFGVAMTETYSNIISGDTVKGLANAGAAVLDFANSWNILEGTLRGFLALGVLKGITTLTVAFKNSAVQISNYGNALNAIKDMSKFADDATRYASAFNLLKTSCVNLTDAQLKQVLANRNLSESQLIEILQLDTLEKEQVQARLSQLGLTQATVEQTAANGAATASTFSFSAAIKGLGVSIKTAIMSNPITFAIMAISTAIGVATSAISKYNQQLEETRRANINAATTASENADKLKDLYNEYTRLASIQDRTTSEEEAFRTAVENITVALGDKAEILKDLTAGTDEYADALARVTRIIFECN